MLTITANLTSVFGFLKYAFLWCYSFLADINITVGNFTFSILGLFIAVIVMTVTLGVAFNIIHIEQESIDKGHAQKRVSRYVKKKMDK